MISLASLFSSSLLRVLGPAELGPQGVANGGDHVIHNADGSQFPPGGVLRLSSLGAGGDTPHHTDHAAHIFQGGNAAPHQGVDLGVGVPGLHPLQALQFRAAQGDGGVALSGNGPRHRGSCQTGVVAGGHQHHPFAVEPFRPLDQGLHILVLGAAYHGNALPSGLGCVADALPQSLLDGQFRAVAHHKIDVLLRRQQIKGPLIVLLSAHRHRHYLGRAVAEEELDQLGQVLLLTKLGHRVLIAVEGV